MHKASFNSSLGIINPQHVPYSLYPRARFNSSLGIINDGFWAHLEEDANEFQFLIRYYKSHCRILQAACFKKFQFLIRYYKCTTAYALSWPAKGFNSSLGIINKLARESFLRWVGFNSSLGIINTKDKRILEFKQVVSIPH